MGSTVNGPTLATTTKGKSMSTPTVTLSKCDRYSTGFSIGYDYGRSMKVTITTYEDDNPVDHTVTVNLDEVSSGLAVIAARMDRQ